VHDFSQEARFSGTARLYGTAAAKRFRNCRLAVVGIGGVGSWAAEAFARSGIGALTLVDLDEICLTNVNRQIHALDGQIGRPKVEAMADRIRSINPGCVVRPLQRFFHQQSADEILDGGFDGVIDAIDIVRPKCHLLARCREQGIPVVTCGAAGGRRDASSIRIADLSRTFNDALLHQVRKNLRGNYGFPAGEKPRSFAVPAVFSPEPPAFPQADGSVGPTRSVTTPSGRRCDAGYGTAAHITAAFGFFAAGELLRLLAEPGPSNPHAGF